MLFNISDELAKVNLAILVPVMFQKFLKNNSQSLYMYRRTDHVTRVKDILSLSVLVRRALFNEVDY